MHRAQLSFIAVYYIYGTATTVSPSALSSALLYHVQQSFSQLMDKEWRSLNWWANAMLIDHQIHCPSTKADKTIDNWMMCLTCNELLLHNLWSLNLRSKNSVSVEFIIACRALVTSASSSTASWHSVYSVWGNIEEFWRSSPVTSPFPESVLFLVQPTAVVVFNLSASRPPDRK